MRKVVFFVLIALILGCLGLSTWSVAAPWDQESYWKPDWQRLSALGPGFVIWESSRTGDWRIWRRNLDGSGLRQISPDEKGRDHFCPHISPDGTRFVYLSFHKGENTYDGGYPKPHKVPLHLCSTEGKWDKVLVPDARAYGEDRCAVWVNAHELIYIDAQGVTRQLNVDTGQSEALTGPYDPKLSPWPGVAGFLINATHTYATSGSPIFSPYDAATKTVKLKPHLDGCQPYFTHDGKWGFWMGGGGGPINRVLLATRQFSPILKYDDPRLPKGRRYLYFPMISWDQRLFACGVSPHQHDHFKSDYDIFVAQIDPDTLELIGKPVRYTFDPHCDRFPDVYLAPLELGDFSGEAPYTVKFTPPEHSGKWQWDFGEGGKVEIHEQARHTFRQPGEYLVKATQGEKTLLGRVRVRAAEPPKVQQVLIATPTEVVVTFSEPVQTKKLKAYFEPKLKLKQLAERFNHTQLVLELATPLKQPVKLHLEKVYDYAQKPNKMPAQVLEVKPILWPGGAKGLVWFWATGKTEGNVSDKHLKLKPRGWAHLDHDYAMVLAHGAYLAEGADKNLLQACKATSELTLEAFITTDNVTQAGPARIVSFSQDPGLRNFTLGQTRDKLIFRLRTTATDLNGTRPEVTLGKLSAHKPLHVVVTYAKGHLKAYFNGKQILDSTAVRGNFRNWQPMHLLFGDEWTGQRDWSGTLEGLALYNQALSPEEIARHYLQYDLLRRARPQVASWKVQVKLLARSKVPTLQEISPYRRALVMSEFEVLKTLSGTPLKGKVRVVQWALLDAKNVPLVPQKPGQVVTLVLEEFKANPQLQSLMLSDTLEPNWDLKVLYDPYPGR